MLKFSTKLHMQILNSTKFPLCMKNFLRNFFNVSMIPFLNTSYIQGWNYPVIKITNIIYLWFVTKLDNLNKKLRADPANIWPFFELWQITTYNETDLYIFGRVLQNLQNRPRSGHEWLDNASRTMNKHLPRAI